jgi:hypothetical protein
MTLMTFPRVQWPVRPMRAEDSVELRLRAELDAVVTDAGALNAYVVDAWDNVWCIARGSQTARPCRELAECVHSAVKQTGVSLARGGRLDMALSEGYGQVYLRSYASCYVILLQFSGPFNLNRARDAVRAALPRLEALTLLRPPDGGPGSAGNDAAATA